MEIEGDYYKFDSGEARSMRFSPEFWEILFNVMEKFEADNLLDINSLSEEDARLFWTEVAAQTFAKPDPELGDKQPTVDEAISLIRLIMEEEMKDMLLAAFRASFEQENQ